MKPKNHKSFFEEVAKDINVHKDVVEDLIVFYYARVRKNLSDLTDTHISVAGLGTFSLRKKKLEQSIKRNKDIIGNLRKGNYKDYEKYLPIHEKIIKMENALDNVNERISKKLKFKNENK